ncbi:MAG TPA: oligosaccharide flippase family protein [Acidobacteriaceae bacterium]|nr:oligosaccharide flippase family protein [Acidobacteriaceae bacterium]
MLQRIRTAIERDPRLSRLVRGGVSALASRAVALLVSAVSLPLTVRYLGAEQYGIWVTVSTTVVLMAMLDLGVANSLTNMISRAYAADDREAARRFYASAFWISSGVSAVLGMTCWALWRRVPWGSLFHVHDAHTAMQAELCVAIAVAFILLSLPLNLINRVLGGYQQTQVSNYGTLLNSVLGLVAILGVVATRGSLVELMVVYSGMMLLGTLGLNVWVMFWDKRWLRPSPRAMSREAMRELLGSGLGFFVLQMSALIVFNSDNLVIAHYLSAVDVTPYSVTWRLAGYASVLQSAIMPSLWPAYAEAYARGDYDWVRKMFWRTARFSMGAAATAVLVLMLFGRAIIRVYVGSEGVPSEVLLVAICGWTLLSAGMDLEAYLLAAVDRVKLQGILSGVAAALNIGLSIYLVKRIGSLGVVLGTILSYVLVLVGPQTAIVWRVLYRPPAREGSYAR